MTTLRISLICALVLLLQSTTAVADEQGMQRDKVWYGNQIMINDAVGMAMMLGGIGAMQLDDSNQFTVGGATVLFAGMVGTWGFGGPIIHYMNGNSNTAWKSLALRWGLPTVTAIAVPAIALAGEDQCGNEEEGCLVPGVLLGVLGFAIGGAVAQATDWFLWSFKEPESGSLGGTALRVIPTFNIAHGGGTVGLGATF